VLFVVVSENTVLVLSVLGNSEGLGDGDNTLGGGSNTHHGAGEFFLLEVTNTSGLLFFVGFIVRFFIIRAGAFVRGFLIGMIRFGVVGVAGAGTIRVRVGAGARFFLVGVGIGTTFVLVFMDLFLNGNSDGVTSLTEHLVGIVGVSVVESHDEHANGDNDEEDGGDELGPEFRDDEGNSPS